MTARWITAAITMASDLIPHNVARRADRAITPLPPSAPASTSCDRLPLEIRQLILDIVLSQMREEAIDADEKASGPNLVNLLTVSHSFGRGVTRRLEDLARHAHFLDQKTKIEYDLCSRTLLEAINRPYKASQDREYWAERATVLRAEMGEAAENWWRYLQCRKYAQRALRVRVKGTAKLWKMFIMIDEENRS